MVLSAARVSLKIASWMCFSLPSARLFLIEHARGQIDFTALQFLRCAVGDFPINPNRERFDVLLALCKRSELRYTSGCMFAPDRVIAGQWKYECSVSIERADGMALQTDRTDLRFRGVIASEHLCQTFEKNRILLRERVASMGQEHRRIHANSGQSIDHDCLRPGRIPRMHKNRIGVLARDVQCEKFFTINDAQIVWR